MPLDKDKFAKIMGLTTSDIDGEALAALRMANKMLSGENLTWGEILAETPREMRISIHREPPYKFEEGWTPPHLRDKVTIDLMFRAVYNQPRTGNEEFWKWLDDVHTKWGSYGSLTQGQYNGLRNSYRRVAKTPAG